jgi:hypothetical protein
MEKGIRKVTIILFLALVIPLFYGGEKAESAIQLMDANLLLKGSIDSFWILRTHIPGQERAYHDSNIGLFLNTAHFEALYTMVKQGDLTINLQGIVRYYYEAITDLDRQMHEAVPAGNRRVFQTPSYFHDDPVNEFYIDIMKGPLNVKVGKQIVTWGETSLQRTSDVVNPLDLRYGQPGYMPFEDLKIGLWMLRCFYQTSIFGEPLIETIFIPGDHQMFRLPPEGTNWGPGVTGLLSDGLFTMLQNCWKDDAPKRLRSIKNYQWGLRIRGQITALANADWTLQYFDAIDSSPVAIPNRANQQVFAFFTERALLGGEVQDVNKVADRIWEYKRTKYVGGTLQWYEEKYLKGVIRGEFALQIGKHFSTDNYYGKDVWIPAFTYKGRTVGGYYDNTKSLVTGVVKRESAGYGLSFDKKVLWPFLMKYNANRSLTINAQVFQDWILNHSHTLVVSQRGRGDRASTAMSLMLQTDWFRQELTTTWTGLYNTSGTGYNVVDFSYAPGDHWRYQIGCMFLYSFTQWSQESGSYDKDMLYFRLKYEW